MTALGEYIKDAMSRPFKWGEHDCCTLCANWFGPRIGVDLLADWRGQYATCSEAMTLLHERGGMVKVFERGIGWPGNRDGAPCAGAIGVMDTGDALIGALYSGDRWMVFSEEGMRFIRHKPSLIDAFWNLPNG